MIPHDISVFQSTPPMQGATCDICRTDSQGRAVSIHAPYAGSDDYRCWFLRFFSLFQSTPPMQGATVIACPTLPQRLCFNPRPLCRERHKYATLFSCISKFQSTPPMQGATAIFSFLLSPVIKFQSTPPMQGATTRTADGSAHMRVSIHAPYAGSDMIDNGQEYHIDWFQSTPPMQGATKIYLIWGFRVTVSIHAPYAGSDEVCAPRILLLSTVSIHAPYAGSDCKISSIYSGYAGFNPRPLCRERLGKWEERACRMVFQSTPPMQGATDPPIYGSLGAWEFQSTPPMQGATQHN